MKKMVIALVLLSTGALVSYGQCDKKVVITSSKTLYLGADSAVQRTEDEQTTVEFDRTNITIIPGNADHKMTGTMKSYVCNWTNAFKDGKTAIKVAVTNDNGNIMNLTITIGGKDGKIDFLAEVDEEPTKKIRLIVDKFEEKK